jgi:ligand-binding sensor domain-containing protein
MKNIYTSFLLLFSIVTFAQTYTYTVYTPSNSNMINATINHITADSNGTLWMCSFAGLASFNGTTFTNYTPDNSGLQINSITKVVVDNLNRKWMSTYQNGIIMYNGTTFTNYTESNSQLPSNVINDIAVDASNNVWIATDSGLSKFNGTTWTNYNEVNAGIWGNNVSSIGIDAGNVYIIVSGTVLMKMNGTTFNSVADGVLKILEVKNNDVYGWTMYGFSKFVNGNLVAGYDYLAGGSCLMDCQPNNIDIDENNKVWVANHIECANGGIQNFSDCTNYTWTGSNEINYVTASKMNNSNTIWVAVAELGLVKMVKNNLSVTDFATGDNAVVYPNPVQNTLNVSSDQKIDNVSIYNVIGQQVLSKTMDASEGTIDVSALGSGSYFVKMAAAGEVKTLKVVKQ